MSVTASVRPLQVEDATPARAVPFAQLQAGDAVAQRVVFTPQLRAGFAQLARDEARIHTDAAFARAHGYDAPILQGMCVSSRFSRLIGMYLPGEDAVVESLSFKFRHPVLEGSTVDFLVRVARVLRPLRVVRLEMSASVGGLECITGEAQCLVREVAA